MNVSCSNGFAPWDVVRRQWRSSSWWWKNWFTGVFPLLNSTDAALYCKNDLVSSQNALSTEDLIFIWFLLNVAKKFHIVGEKTFYCAKTLCHDNFPINFYTTMLTKSLFFNFVNNDIPVFLLNTCENLGIKDLKSNKFFFLNIIGKKSQLTKFPLFFLISAVSTAAAVDIFVCKKYIFW